MPTRQSPAQRKTVKRVMHEFKHGELKTAAGKRKVKNPKQAIAIALHEAGASKNENPKENARNLRRTKEKERRGETGQDAVESRTRRAASTKRSSSGKTSSTRKRTKSAAARSSTSTRSSTSKRSSGTRRASGTKRASSAKRTSGTKRTTSAARSSSTRRTAATKRASSTGKKRSSGNGKTRAELYKEATRREIAGRSKMSKAQLERALHQ
jgi:Family of unknown function (DUF6496)